MAEIAEIRILPPFAIARLGSSADPMDNYSLEIADPIGPRRIIAAETLLVERTTGEVRAKTPPFEVRFRDAHGNIRPVAPFLEVWVRMAGSEELVPLTIDVLRLAGLTPADVKWSVKTANIKAFRRTGDPRDRIEASSGSFSDHAEKPLKGECLNFLPDKSIPLGSVQYIEPNTAFPELRLRFTPAAGKVYGPPSPDGKPPDGNLAAEVYDPDKGHWKGYQDAADPKQDPILDIRKATNPGNVYAGTDLPDGSHRVSWGYLDDECDGIVDVEISVSGKRFTAYARIAAGPPTFAPDSMPVRTVYDELEQAMWGPELESAVTGEEIEQVRQIVRCALETVRLMNTGQMNKFSKQRGVGMARMDYLDVNRAGTPIVDPALADSLAIRSRHERILLALESGSLAWFARVLREHDEVGDLTDDGRKKMPALMRGADARHLALTRRQINKVRAAAEYILHNSAEGKSEMTELITPKNLTAQLQYQGLGNPPTTHPHSAISNAFPGLEMDFRNVWRRILKGLQLHEASNLVVAVDDDADPRLRMLASGWRLMSIEDTKVMAPVKGPLIAGGPTVDLPDTTFQETVMPLEWSNALAEVLREHAGRPVRCKFQNVLDVTQPLVELEIELRPFFATSKSNGDTVKQPVISRELAPPGELTQSLCSPWQSDYRECACFYWAANRPDYVNVEAGPDGASTGNNWMQRDRTPETPKVYLPDDWMDPDLINYLDLYRNWEKSLRFVIGGKDEDPPPPGEED